MSSLKFFTLRIKQIIFSVLVILIAAVVSLLLLPFVLVLILSFMIFTWLLVAKQRRPAKGDVEILPAEKKPKPPVKATSDQELEIKIETLQRKTGKQIDSKEDSEGS